MQKFIDTPEAAAFLGMQPCTLEAWRCRGGGPRYVKMGRAVRYGMDDLEDFTEASAQVNTSALDERNAA